VRDAKGASFTCVVRRRWGVNGAERGRGLGPWIVQVSFGVVLEGRRGLVCGGGVFGGGGGGESSR